MNGAALTDTPRPAATVVLLRDSNEGLQTLLLKRSAQLRNMAGLHVFPGGKLEHEDSAPESLALLDQSADTLRELLGEADADALLASGLHVAALREALEECGVLLAEPTRGDAQLDAPRARRMLAEGQHFAQVLAALGLRMATRTIVPWSRWITPKMPARATRRFDARFFLAQAPTRQQASHDNEETIASLWCTPRSALERYRDGELDLVPPQIMSLAHLHRYATVREALQAARAQHPPTIEPEPCTEGELHGFCYPGDALHPLRERALPGPTRLYWQGRWLLPRGGLAELLGD